MSPLNIPQSAALLAAIKEYEASKWKVIGQKVGKPAKVRVSHSRCGREATYRLHPVDRPHRHASSMRGNISAAKYRLAPLPCFLGFYWHDLTGSRGKRSQKLALRRNRGAGWRHWARARARARPQAQAQAGSSRTCISLECRRFLDCVPSAHIPLFRLHICGEAFAAGCRYILLRISPSGLARAWSSFSRRRDVDYSTILQSVTGSLTQPSTMTKVS